MNNKSIKKTITLTSLATSVFALGAVAFAVNENRANNNVALQSNISTKGITDNSNQQSLINPDEVFYSSKDLATLNVWDSTSVNQTNKAYFYKLKTNLENVVQGSSTAKTTLLKICEDVDKFIEFKKVEQEITSNPVLSPYWESLKQGFLDSIGAVENFNDIPNIQESKTLFEQLSGIASGTVIKEISYKSLSKIDLIIDSSSQSIDGGGSSVIGDNFKQLIKIATLDVNTPGDYILDFEYSKSNSIRSAKASLILKNTNNQLKDASNASEILNNIDIFGRYKDMGTFNIDQSSYEKILKSVVVSKNGDEIAIFIRVDDKQKFTNIQFASDSAKPTSFGILDVQASSNETFLDLINIANSSYQKVSTLVNINDSSNVLQNIQFYSDRIVTSKITLGATANKNRDFTFYQGSDQEFSMILNYALSSSSGDYYSYSPLTTWENGVDTESPISLIFVAPNQNPSQFTTQCYSFYAPLLEEMPADVASQFPAISKIEFNSTISQDKKVAKQSISFSDNFYGIGQRTSWSNVDISGQYQVLIPDITAKIFAEKPETYTDSDQTKSSTFEAKEQIDERTQIISIFAQIYEEWSQPNSGIFNGTEYGFNTQLVQKNNGISVVNAVIRGSGNDIYNRLNNYWALVSGIMKDLFETGKDYKTDRYTIASNNSSTSIVNNYLIKNSEYVSSQANIEQVILDSIQIWNDNVTGEDVPTLSQLPADAQKALAQNFLKLIQIQFETILNEFNSKQINPIYKAFIEAFTDSQTTTMNVLKSPSEIFDLVEGSDRATLISYKSNAWNELATSQEVKLLDGVKAVFDLLYFGSSTPNGTLIGDSLFTASNINSSFRNLNSESVVNFSQANSSSIKISQIRIMGALLSFFGYNIETSINNMLKHESKFKLDFDIKTAFINIMSNLSSENPTRISKLPNGDSTTSYYLDDLISGANAISALKYKLSQLTTTRDNNTNLVNKIEAILANQQASNYELSIWSNIIDNDYKFGNSYSPNLSGRNGTDAQNVIYNKLIEDETLLRSRVVDYSSAIAEIQKYLKYVWFVIVALIGVGILTSSTVGIATKSKQIKLSSRPVLKMLLIAGIVLGIAVVALSIVFGVLPLI